MKKLIELLAAGKNLVRTGWMLRGVPPAIGETVSQHSWEAAILSLEISHRLMLKGHKIDPYKAASLALVHDLLEGLTGDFPKYTTTLLGDERDLIERRTLEDAGLSPILEKLLKEWMSQNTLESKVAKIAEQLSTYIQAKRYVCQGYKDAEEIADSVLRSIERMSEKLSLEGFTLEDILSELQCKQ